VDTNRGSSRAIFRLQTDVKRETLALGSSAAHPAADRTNAEVVWDAADTSHSQAFEPLCCWHPNPCSPSPVEAKVWARVAKAQVYTLHRLVTTCGKPTYPGRQPMRQGAAHAEPSLHDGGDPPSDVRHLGLNRSRTPSRGRTRGGPSGRDNPGNQGVSATSLVKTCSSGQGSQGASRESNDPPGARVRGSVADVEKTHLPPGAWPAARQATPLRVTFCGGLLGDDEGPIRSGRKGARLERAMPGNRCRLLVFVFEVREAPDPGAGAVRCRSMATEAQHP
jgi:hypothetical protein